MAEQQSTQFTPPSTTTPGESADAGDSAVVFSSSQNSPPQPKMQLPPQGPSRMQTFAGVAGNILEWYDFAVFGFFSDTIGKIFFPPQSGHAAIVESFAVFGGAFLMRPIGGMLLGYVGDKFGRKTALEISIFLMAFPTFAMGCLPTYAQVGWFSIVLLILVRLLQGLSVGGQLMSSLVFTLEQHDKSQWGLYGSLVMAAANFGTLLGGIVGFTMRESLTEQQLLDWGWRVPFLAGIIVSFCGIYLRYHCDEYSHLTAASSTSSPPANPLRVAFSKGNRRALGAASLVPMLWSAGFYTTFVWMAIYMETLLDDPVPHAFGVNSAALLLSVCILFPLAGIWSDKWGRRNTMTIGGVAFGVTSPVMIYIIGLGNPYGAFVSQCIMGVALSYWGAPMMAWLVESFSPEARLTSVAVGYNVAQATIGGLAPSIATLLVDSIGAVAPGFLLSIVAILSLIGLRCVAPHDIEATTATTTTATKTTTPEIEAVDLGDKEIA